MKKIILLAIIAAAFMFPYSAFADNPSDTAAGIVITALGTQCVMTYTDVSTSEKAPVNATNISTTVMPMYGFDPLENLTYLNSTTPNVPELYTYVLTNEGNDNNATFEVRVTLSYGGNITGAGWLTTVTTETTGTTPILSAATTGVSTWAVISALGEDANRRVYVKVTPSTWESESPSGAYCVVTLEAHTVLIPAGVYYGANGIVYGGTFESFTPTCTTIETSVMRMTRVATVDAPVPAAGGKFTGDSHAAVPGAVITFTIMTTNDGGALARKVVIIDKVPTNTLAAHVGAYTGSGTIPFVNVTVAQPNAFGWSYYYATTASPTMGYDDITGWTTITSTPKSLTYEAGQGPTSSVTYVRFQKLTVLTTEDAKTFTWGVTIR